MPDQTEAEKKAAEIVRTVEVIRSASKEERASWLDSLKAWAILHGLGWLLSRNSRGQ